MILRILYPQVEFEPVLKLTTDRIYYSPRILEAMWFCENGCAGFVVDCAVVKKLRVRQTYPSLIWTRAELGKNNKMLQLS